MNPFVAPVVRRAILDLLADIGGEHNDDTLSIQLNQLGHRVARRDVREQIVWLTDQKLVRSEELGMFLVVRLVSDGADVAAGRLVIDGISKLKTGE
jgi:hypothetical protein